MKNAVGPRPDVRDGRLLTVHPGTGSFTEARFADLPVWLRPGDLLVLNDAASLPASLPARCATCPDPGQDLEIRLAGTGAGERDWWAVLFGSGDWRTPTEDRAAPPPVTPGTALRIGDSLFARVEEVSPLSNRLLRLSFDRTGGALYREIYRVGQPIQYSYLSGNLALWDVQTAYGARPWAVEMPSAGRPLTWDILAALKHRGVGLARLTHAAGLSATGDPGLDARLPLPERYDLPEATVRAVRETRRAGGRIIAVGTTVVRALEGNASTHHGELVPGTGVTDLRLGPGTRRRVVDAILTGIHESGTSHLELLEAFAPKSLLERANAYAEERSFLQHEFGDSMLVLPVSREAARPASPR